jgi:MFS family permease
MENKYSLQLAGYIKEKNWTAVSGYIFFIGLMAAGYAYNLTFVQLGLVDLGKRVVGLSDSQVAAQMALLAFVTCVTALLFGYFMKRHERVSRLPGKLRLIVAVVAAQAILTGIIPLVQTRGVFTAWVFFASLALGVGVPATFSLAVDLVPVRDRGLVAALITSLAYLGAAVLFPQWSIEKFRTIFLWPMVAGAAVLGVAAFKSNPVVIALSQQYASPEFGRGRFVRKACGQIDRRFVGIVVLMFGIYFIDSLGFLRIIRTPIYLNTAWQSPEADMRLFIGITHVAGAAIAGIFYSVLRTRSLFLWVFGIFSLVHLLYAFHARFTPGSGATILMTGLV